MILNFFELLITICIGAVIALTFYGTEKIYNNKYWYKRIIFISFLVYIGCLSYVVFFSKSVADTCIETDVFRWPRNLFLLLKEIIHSIAWSLRMERWPGIYYGDYYIAKMNEGIANIFLFVPMGYFLPNLFYKKNWKLRDIVFCGFLFSLMIEVSQLITGKGTFDFDDLINNTFGCFIGFLYFRKLRYGENLGGWQMSIKVLLKKALKNTSVLKLYNVLNPKNKVHIGRNNEFNFDDAQLNGISVQIRGKNNKIHIGKNSILNSCVIRIYGDDNTINIAEECLVNNATFWIEDNDGRIDIKRKTTINGKTDFSVIEGTCITVNEDCMFSSNISLRTGDSHSIIDDAGDRINPSKDIFIGNHVWIGADVTCLKGVKIPDNTIIGTGSIVNKEFDTEGTVIAGNPAKVVKQHIGWLRERI